jgi:hypothetical protein
MRRFVQFICLCLCTVWVPTQVHAGDWGFRSEAAFEQFNLGLAALERGELETARAQFEVAAK